MIAGIAKQTAGVTFLIMTDSRRKRGRKPIPLDEQRIWAVTCRLTNDESNAVDAARGSVSRGEYIRRAALSAPPRVVPKINRDAWVELARLSANLNQFVRHLNSGSAQIPDDFDFEELRRAVDALRADLIGLSADEADDES